MHRAESPGASSACSSASRSSGHGRPTFSFSFLELHKGQIQMSTANVGPKRLGRFRSLCLTLGVISGLAAATVAYQYLPHHDPVRLEAWNKVQPRLQSTDEA